MSVSSVGMAVSQLSLLGMKQNRLPLLGHYYSAMRSLTTACYTRIWNNCYTNNGNDNGLKLARSIQAVSPLERFRVIKRHQLIGHGSTTTVRLIHSSGSNDNDVEQNERLLPPLMEFPHILWPSVLNSIRNWFFITFIIKPYFDKEFTMNDFIAGVKEAVSVVSNKLSEGKLDELEGLVEPTALSQIKKSISKFTVFQQQLLSVAAEDVFFAFPFQIGIIIPDDKPEGNYAEGTKPPQTRHVEITVCLHVLRGLAEKQRRGETGVGFNFQEFTKDEANKYNVMICNYRFFKDFTKDSSDASWIVNMANHFLPSEVTRF